MKSSIWTAILLIVGFNLTSCIVIEGYNQVTSSTGAICEQSAQAISKKTEYLKDKITGIKISNAIDLNVIIGSDSKAEIQGSIKDIEKVQINNYNGIINIGLKTNSCTTTPIKIELILRDENILSSFDGSGATSNIIEDRVIDPKNLKVTLSGASKLGLTATEGISNTYIVVSGASKLTAKASIINNLDVDTSGASFAFIQTNSVDNGNFEASGASMITSNSIKEARTRASGASTIELRNSIITQSDATGASTITNK